MPSSYLFLNDIRVHYLHWNLGDAGRPVILLHGLASNARIWEKVAPRLARGSGLAQASLVPLAPDLRGHGLTDKPDGDYGFETYARDLAAFSEACGFEKPLLVGHSWGAMLALDYAARFSLGPRAPAGVILVDGGLIQMDVIPGATWEETRSRLEPPRLAGSRLDDFIARLSRVNSHWRPDRHSQQIILANFEISPEDTLAPRLTYERHMQIVRAMWEFQTFERFSRLRCPALALPARPSRPYSPGEREFLERKEWGLQRALAAQPGLQVTWMENSIHDIPLQHPARLADQITRFESQL
jgi:pimeloyl-ACP methyl ester carboxylesterase